MACEARSKNIFISADTNIDLFKTGLSTAKLLEICDCFGFTPNVFVPTRVTKISSTCIDNIFSNISARNTANTVADIGASDHKLLLLSFEGLSMSSPKTSRDLNKNSKLIRKFTDSNLDGFLRALNNTDWGFNKYNNANLNYEHFLTIFLNLFNEAFPKTNKINNIKTKKKWITRGIQISAKKKKYLHQKSKWNKTPNS